MEREFHYLGKKEGLEDKINKEIQRNIASNKRIKTKE